MGIETEAQGDSTKVSRRQVLKLGGALAVASGVSSMVTGCATARPRAGAMSFEEYASYDGLGLADLVRRGQVTPNELLDVALQRLDAVNPRINAVVVRFDDRAREQIRRGLAPGPFRGVPFVLKDIHADLQGTVTTNGCRFFRDRVDDHDSELVRRYLQAGLVIFGKAASPELGLTPSTESALHGATHNPWNLAYTAGGSSGGSAAAVAAGIVPWAHASDGGGSIRIPASCCGVFGFKPSRERIPVGPPIAGEGWAGAVQQHAVTRSVRDSAALLDASAGPVLGSSFNPPPGAGPLLPEVAKSPGKLRIAMARRAFEGAEIDPECVRAIDEAAQLCRQLGHRVEEVMPPLDFNGLSHAMGMVVVPTNVALELDNRAKELGRPVTEADVEPMTWAMYQFGKRITGTDYEAARHVFFRAGTAMADFQRNWDVLLSTTLGSPPLRLGILTLTNVKLWDEAAARFVPFTMVFNCTGQPSMSVPLHWTPDGLPVGVMFSGRYGEDATLFRLAAQLEQAQPWANRRPVLA